MNVTIALARVYGVGLPDRGSAAERRGGTTIVLADFPRKRWQTSVTLGEPVAWLFAAERLARAVARTLSRTLSGALEGEDRTETIRRLVADERLGPSPDEREWWVSIVCEHNVDLPEDESMAEPFMWLSFERAESLERSATRDARGALDVVSILVREIVQASNTTPVFDRVYFRADGKPSFRLPEITMHAPTVTITKPLRSVDATGLERELRRAPAALKLRNVAYWWARAREVRDPRERFQFAFIGLETLAHELARPAHEHVLPQLRIGPTETAVPVPVALVENPVTLPLAAKFALVALLLAPASAVDDTLAFKDLKKTRDALAHGDLDVSASLPDGKAVALLNKYVELALAHLSAASS